MEPDEKAITEAREAAGTRELHQIDIEHDGEVFSILACAPTRVEWNKLLSTLTSDDDIAKKNKAHEDLVLAVTKWPPRPEVQAFFAKKFGSVLQVTDQLGDIVGAGAKVRAKKL